MKNRILFLVLLVVSVVVLGGCQSSAAAQSGETSADSASVSSGEVANAASDRALYGTNLLALGTFKLEESEYAVTPEQAANLLPFWQMLQSGELQGTTESDAVVRQIESQMTADQMADIDAMGLTLDDYQAWMEAQGIEMAPAGDAQGEYGAANDDRAAMREKMQDMTEEERAAAMSEMGGERPEGAGEAGSGGGARGAVGGDAMLTSLIELLTARAAA